MMKICLANGERRKPPPPGTRGPCPQRKKKQRKGPHFVLVTQGRLKHLQPSSPLHKKNGKDLGKGGLVLQNTPRRNGNYGKNSNEELRNGHHQTVSPFALVQSQWLER